MSSHTANALRSLLATERKRKEEGRYRWRCGRCGYQAHSDTWTVIADKAKDHVEVAETHTCPECGESWWLDEETWLRSKLHEIEGPQYDSGFPLPRGDGNR